jgi:GntR family transcriptional regulator
MARKGTLVARISESLRTELAAGDHPPGSRLPTEAELSARFEVSRPTVRAALRELEALGLVRTQHGVGTFVVENGAVRAGLERMDSITDSIRATGREPGMEYASRMVRVVLPEEAARMGVSGGTEVLEIRRRIFADDEVVAYSYDLMPTEILPADFDPEQLQGSIFAFLRDELSIYPDHGVAEIHAVSSGHVGWGDEAAHHDLFVLLNQLHYDTTDRLILYSRTYFIEGRYSFTILRRN